MFKSVEYARFEGQPDLKAKAEQLTPMLADRIRRWQDEVGVAWSPSPGNTDGGLNLTLEMAFPNGVAGTVTTEFSPADLSAARPTRRRCRDAWVNLLGVILLKNGARIRADMAEPLEV